MELVKARAIPGLCLVRLQLPHPGCIDVLRLRPDLRRGARQQAPRMLAQTVAERLAAACQRTAFNWQSRAGTKVCERLLVSLDARSTAGGTSDARRDVLGGVQVHAPFRQRDERRHASRERNPDPLVYYLPETRHVIGIMEHMCDSARVSGATVL